MESNRSHDAMFRTEYTLKFTPDKDGKPFFEFSDVKPGEEASVEDTARRLLGLAKTSPAPSPAHPTPTVAEAAKAVLARPHLKPTTVKEYRRAFAEFEKVFGAATPLGEIPQERFAKFADLINEDPGRSSKTKKSVITNALQLYRVARARNTMVPKVSAEELTLKHSTPMGQGRRPFSLEELEALFSNALRYRHSEPAKWWATVAPALLGCRIEELAQARLDGDFQTDPRTFVHYLKISEATVPDDKVDSPKSVKTDAGWRNVPIHSALIEAGFADYLKAERDAGAITPFSRKWPAWRDACGVVKHSHAISKWGGRELRSLQKRTVLPTDGRLVYFHSLRYTFNTELQLAGVPPEWRKALSGHSSSEMTALYSQGPQDIGAAAEKIEKGLASIASVLDRVCQCRQGDW